jgi:hypothetical protein
MSQDGRDALIGMLFFIGIGAVIVWAISFAIRSSLGHREKQHGATLGTGGPIAPVPPREPRGFPVVTAAAVNPAALKRFFVVGVNRDTQEDVTVRIDAETEANAKVKGELQGIVVTEVLEI